MVLSLRFSMSVEEFVINMNISKFLCFQITTLLCQTHRSIPPPKLWHLHLHSVYGYSLFKIWTVLLWPKQPQVELDFSTLYDWLREHPEELTLYLDIQWQEAMWVVFCYHIFCWNLDVQGGGHVCRWSLLAWILFSYCINCS